MTFNYYRFYRPKFKFLTCILTFIFNKSSQNSKSTTVYSG